MTDRKARMIEDRYLRDSARALLEADLEHLKADLTSRGLGTRIVDRAREGAIDLYEDAIDAAEDNKGALAALIAAIFVWFARNPILAVLGLAAEDEEDDDEWGERDKAAER